MQGNEHYLVGIKRVVVVHNQADMFQKVGQGWIFFGVTHDRNEFFKVFNTAGRFDRLVHFEHFKIAGIFQHLGCQFVRRDGVHGFAPLLKVGNQVGKVGFGFAAELVFGQHFFNRHVHGNLAETGFLLYLFNAFGADASGGFVDNPLEGQIVVRLQNDAEIGEGVADFRAFVELRAADDLIGNGFGNKFFFKFAGLKSGAHQNRHVGVLRAVAQMIVDLVDDIAGFVFTVVVADNLDFGVVAVLRRRVFGDFEGFAQTAVVVADEAGSCGKDIGRRAVIALKADGLGVVKVFFKTQDVFDFGAAPGINRLVVVADAAEVAAFLAQQAQKKVLGNVGVLILVDHDVFELGLVFVKHVGIGEQDVQRIEENVAKVDAV